MKEVYMGHLFRRHTLIGLNGLIVGLFFLGEELWEHDFDDIILPFKGDDLK
jgi:hypothetical protein